MNHTRSARIIRLALNKGLLSKLDLNQINKTASTNPSLLARLQEAGLLNDGTLKLLEEEAENSGEWSEDDLFFFDTADEPQTLDLNINRESIYNEIEERSSGDYLKLSTDGSQNPLQFCHYE